MLIPIFWKHKDTSANTRRAGFSDKNRAGFPELALCGQCSLRNTSQMSVPIFAKKRVLMEQRLNRFVCNSTDLALSLEAHCDWFTGVPDSDLSETISSLPNWNFATRENHAIGMAFGAALGGKKPAVLLQNSGLGLALDAIVGTFSLYRLPLLLVISNRGTLEWEEPQHLEWGKVTRKVLELFSISQVWLEDFGVKSVDVAVRKSQESRMVCGLVIERGNLRDHAT